MHITLFKPFYLAFFIIVMTCIESILRFVCIICQIYCTKAIDILLKGQQQEIFKERVFNRL